VQFQCNDNALKIATGFSDDVHFLHAHHLKFTINANRPIVYLQLRQHSACPSYALIIMVSIFNRWSVAALTVSRFIWPQQFNRAHFR